MFTKLLVASGTSGAEQFGYYVGVAMASIIMIGAPVLFVWSVVKFCKKKEKTYLVLLILSAIPTALMVAGLCVGMLQGLQKQADYVDDSTEVPVGRNIKIANTPLNVTLPDHWDRLKQINENAAFQAGNLRREEYCLIFPYHKLDVSSNAESLYYAGLTELEVNLDHSRLIEERQPRLLDKTSRQAEITGSTNGINLVYLDTIIEGKEHYYRVLQWTLPSKSKTALPVFQEFLSSIQESTGESKNQSPSPVD
jgi:hypothetical protein